MCTICNLILAAKSGNQDSMLEIINIFRPLIKKYTFKMNYEDAENDLILSMVQLIYNMPDLSNDGQAVNYINQSIYTSYIRYIKAQIKKRENEYQYDAESTNDLNALYEDFSEPNIDLYNAIKQLPSIQQQIIMLKFFYMMSDKEIMAKLNLSRQSIYKNKIKALSKLKIMLDEV